MSTEIFVRPVDDSDATQIEDFTKFDAILRRRDVGSWSIEAPNSQASQILATPGAGIVVERDGQVLISGPVNSIGHTEDGDTSNFVISGISDSCVLWDTAVYPGPPIDNTLAAVGQVQAAALRESLSAGSSPLVFTDDAYDVRPGIAETIMCEYVDANCISGRWARPVPGLSLSTDFRRGGQVIGRGRFQSVGEILQEMAVAGGGLGFSVNDMVFEVYLPVDRTDEITFSKEMGNVFGVEYTWTAPQATHVLVAGGGENTNRVFYLAADEAAAARWGRRIELFQDDRSSTDINELIQTGNKALADNAEQVSITVKPIDLPDFTYGTDYVLDDLVAAEVDGVLVTGRIAQVEITLDENGETIQPSVDSATSQAAALSLLTFDRIRKLQRRMSALERAL